MDKNIEAYVKDNNHYIFPSDLVWRIIGIFFYNYLIIILTEILSPYGFNSVDFISEKVLPYVIALTIISFVISAVFIILYIKKKVWSFFAIRAVTNGYIAITFLIYSILRYDGYNLYFQDIPFLVAKVLSFIIMIVLYPIVIKKKVLPNFSQNIQDNRLSYVCITIAVVVSIQRIIRSFNNINVPEIMTLIFYIMSLLILSISIQQFVKAYYAKKYVTVDNFGIVPPTARKRY